MKCVRFGVHFIKGGFSYFYQYNVIIFKNTFWSLVAEMIKKKKTLRLRIAILNAVAVTLAILITSVISSISIAVQGHESSEQALSLLCETGKNNLNYYFKSVEQSVNIVSGLIDDNLDSISDEEFNTKFSTHVQQTRLAFLEAADHTNGVLTFYYRMDPEITALTNEKGFWYTNLDGNGFIDHEVTNISDSENECPWFWIPKQTGQPVWLSPYDTDSLQAVTVVSYNAPVYRKSGENNVFIGVVGIEISYNTLGEQIKDIKIHRSGFAFIVDNDTGSIIYHPILDILGMPVEERPSMPGGFLDSIKSEKHHIEYTFQGVKKHAYWRQLSNNMSIVVAVPLSEVNETWIRTVVIVASVSLALIGLTILFTIFYTRKITNPLKELTEAAQKINNGEYDFQLSYQGDDEIGVLTATTNKLVDHLRDYIEDLNSLAYADALTSTKNKSAFDAAIFELEQTIDNSKEPIEFAIAIFDCDDLKQINDKYGHDKGNIYLKNSSILMTRVFQNSDVYRLGGDEFAIILQGKDYKNREKLKDSFFRKCKDVCSLSKEPWEQIKVSVGIATFDPEIDHTVKDVIVHADHLMYQNKRSRKKNLA